MEKRPLFVLGDLVANAFVATIAVAATNWMLGGAIGMIPGMLIGMLIGMIIALPVGLVMLAPLLGAMEVLSPCMISGMLGGMWGGMMALSGDEVLNWGIGTGIAVVIVIYIINALVTGPQKLEN